MRSQSSSGWTLVELVIVLVVVGTLASVTFGVLLEAMRIYARTAPTEQLAYQSQLTSERLRRDLRSLRESSQITVFQPQELAFETGSGGTVDYRLMGSELRRNGRLLAEGITGLRFNYITTAGGFASSSDEVALVTARVVLTAGGAERQVVTAIHPRRRQP